MALMDEGSGGSKRGISARPVWRRNATKSGIFADCHQGNARQAKIGGRSCFG
jgi:hypothetical protein